MSAPKNHNRVQSGVPAGGQFDFKHQSDPTVELGGVAGIPEMPDVATADVDTLRALAEHPDDLVRADLTSSPRIPDDVLERLSEPDQSVAVRLAAASTGYPGTADRAANDPDVFVRLAAVDAWDLSPAERRRLEADRDVHNLMGMLSR